MHPLPEYLRKIKEKYDLAPSGGPMASDRWDGYNNDPESRVAGPMGVLQGIGGALRGLTPTPGMPTRDQSFLQKAHDFVFDPRNSEPQLNERDREDSGYYGRTGGGLDRSIRLHEEELRRIRGRY